MYLPSKPSVPEAFPSCDITTNCPSSASFFSEPPLLVYFKGKPRGSASFFFFWLGGVPKKRHPFWATRNSLWRPANQKLHFRLPASLPLGCFLLSSTHWGSTGRRSVRQTLLPQFLEINARLGCTRSAGCQAISVHGKSVGKQSASLPLKAEGLGVR